MNESNEFDSQSATDTDNEPTNNIELGKPFFCYFCSKRFGTKDNLTLHLQIHSIEKSFTCTICSKIFQTEVILENHYKKQHMANYGNETQVVSVPSPTRSIMSKLNATKITLKPRHVSKLSYSRISYPCDECGKSFASRAMLTVHFRIHTKERPFECELCHKRFSQIGNLKAHYFIHTDEKPFKCDLCDKRFIQKGNLQSHYKTHTNEKPFGCSACHKRFTQKGNLIAHERSHHFTQKPYECSLCHKTFATQLYFKKHLEAHGLDTSKSASVTQATSLVQTPSISPAKPSASRTRIYECTVCNESFDRKRNLNSHYRVHGDITGKLKLVSAQPSISMVYNITSDNSAKYCPSQVCSSRIGEIEKKLSATKSSKLEGVYQSSDAAEVSNRPASKDSTMDYSDDSNDNSSLTENQQESDESSDTNDTSKFDQKPNLATITVAKLYKCDLCPKDFSQKQDLLEHSKVHKGDKPFQCEQCPKRFSQTNSLEFHCKSVHGGRKLNVALENIQKKLLGTPMASYKPLKEKLVLRKQDTHSWEVYNAAENSSSD